MDIFKNQYLTNIGYNPMKKINSIKQTKHKHQNVRQGFVEETKPR